MKSSTKILIIAIVLPALAFIAFYFISRSRRCIPDCTNKSCGESDGCSGKCKICPKGSVCDGISCQKPKYIPKYIPKSTPEKTKGICYFDIDGTLTTANGDRDAIMRECLDNNFAIGIITASNRKIEDVCDGDVPRENWMPKLLCEQFNKNGGKMYNSTRVVAGNTNFPVGYPYNKDQGYIKGFDMDNGRNSFYPNIPDKCVVLFDDQLGVLNGVKTYNSNFQTQCANTACGLKNGLDISIVKNKIKEMKENGCR